MKVISKIYKSITLFFGVLQPPNGRKRKLSRIRVQMEFWHKEENRTMKNAFACFRLGDRAGYERWRLMHKNAILRCEKEVRVPLREMSGRDKIEPRSSLLRPW